MRSADRLIAHRARRLVTQPSIATLLDRERTALDELAGDIAIGPEGKPSIHAHAVLGRRDGAAVAGHLQEGYVRPTLEVIVTESPKHLCKSKDVETGLALIKP